MYMSITVKYVIERQLMQRIKHSISSWEAVHKWAPGDFCDQQTTEVEGGGCKLAPVCADGWMVSCCTSVGMEPPQEVLSWALSGLGTRTTFWSSSRESTSQKKMMMSKQPIYWSCRDVWRRVSGCVGGSIDREILHEK